MSRCLIAGLCLVLGALPARALHKVTPGAVRLTHGQAVVHPSTRSWGYVLAFSSTEDLAGTLSTGRQVFVFGLFPYDCLYGTPNAELAACPQPPAPVLVQATSGAGSPDNPSATAAGTLVTFDADGGYAGGAGPGVGHRQVFVLDFAANQLTRITDAADGDSTHPSLSEGGRHLVFESTAGLAGGPAGVSQIYHYDLVFGGLTRLTHGAGPSRGAMLSKLGQKVGFESTAALLGDNHDTATSQIFWYDLRLGQLHQLTNGNGPSRHAWVAHRLHSQPLKKQIGRGVAIAFDSEATNLPGTVGGPGTQSYIGATGSGDLPPIAQLTPVAAPGCSPSAGESSYPAIDTSGRRIGFVSTGDLLCNATTGSRAFIADVRRAPFAVSQLTARGDVAGPIGMSLGSWFMTLATTDDLTGTGVCGHQLQLIDFVPGRWGAAATAGTKPVEPVAADPAAGCDDANACTTDTCVAATCQHAVVCP